MGCVGSEEKHKKQEKSIHKNDKETNLKLEPAKV